LNFDTIEPNTTELLKVQETKKKDTFYAQKGEGAIYIQTHEKKFGMVFID